MSVFNFGAFLYQLVPTELAHEERVSLPVYVYSLLIYTLVIGVIVIFIAITKSINEITLSTTSLLLSLLIY